LGNRSAIRRLRSVAARFGRLLRQFTEWSFGAAAALSCWGNAESKRPTPVNGGHQEEHMGLNPFALNVVMALIALSIPALVFAGCIVTRRPKTPPEPHQAAPQIELDRAA
jgi:hypothetical protein